MTNITYITFLQVIEAFAAKHLQIKRFHSDFPDNIPDFSNDKEDFPILFVSPTNSIFQINTNLFNVRIYCFDLITEGRENINSILSDTHGILSDLHIYLSDGNIPAIDILTSSNVTPLNNQLLDYAAGWYIDVQVEVSKSDLCAIPFSEPPIIGESICNSLTFTGFVPASRRLTINNVTYDLSEDRTWVIFSGTSEQFVKGDGSLDDTDYEPTENKQNDLIIDGSGRKFPTVDAVNFVTNELAKGIYNTGFLETSDLFSLYVFDDFTLGINGSTTGIVFKPLLDAPPFSFESSVVQLTSRTVPLSDIGFLDDGYYVKFVGYRQSDDAIIFSDLSFHQTPTTCQLGLVLIQVSGGTISFIDPARNVVNKPDIGCYSNLEVTAIGMESSVVIAPADTFDLHIQNDAGALVGISVNWHGLNNDLLPIGANTATTFTYLVPLVPNTFPIVTTDLIDPTQYFNGTILTPLSTNTKATVQRFLITVAGTIVVQYGEFEYNNFQDAKAAIFIAPFTDILPTRSAVEIGRLATRKTTSNLHDDTEAYFITTGGGSGGGSSSATVAWGSITGDITNQTDLVEYIDEQVAGSAPTGDENFVVKFNDTGVTESNIIDDGSIINLTTNALVNNRILGSGGFNDINNSNTAFGFGTLQNNFNGLRNTAIGSGSLSQMLNGNDNTAIGRDSLSNGDGNNNTAIGAEALYFNNAGDNVAVGIQAGRNTGGLAPNNSSSSIFIGAYSKSQTVNDFNTIMIGFNNQGNGSNTVTIGNTQMTDNFFYGNINADAFKVYGGLSTQFLKANGTLDNSTYLTNVTLVGDVFGTGTNLINTTLQTVNVAGVYTKVLTDVKGRVLSGFNDTTVYEPAANKVNNTNVDGTGVKFPTVDAVNLLTNNIARATLNTGFLTVSDAFSLYVANSTTLGISGSSIGMIFKTLLETPPFSPASAVKQITSRTIALNTISLSGDGNFVKFVGYRQSDDTVVFSDNSFQSIDAICQLGLVLIQKSGATVTFIDAERNVVNKPDIAGYSNLEQTAIGLSSTVAVAPADSADLKIKNSTGDLTGISVNWHGFNNDTVEISGSSATTFVYLSPALTQNAYPIVETNLIDPTKYWNGSALVTVTAANNATVQRVLLTVNKNIVVQYGEFQYTTFQDAKNDVFIAPFTDILPAQSFIEIGRIVLRKSTTNLQIDTDALFITSGSGGGGNGTSTAFWGQIQGDINSQTDLTNYVKAATTGTTNFISKFDSTGLTNSRLVDNGTFLGIEAVSALTLDIQFGNTAATRTIGIEPSDITTIGKDLIIKAGRASNPNDVSNSFSPLGISFIPNLSSVGVNPINGDVYVGGNQSDIYKQTGGKGAFVAMGFPSRYYTGIAFNPNNGDIYFSVSQNDVFKLVGGVGSLVAQGAPTNRSWYSIAVNPNNGDVFVGSQGTSGGDLWKQTGGVGSFVAITAPPTNGVFQLAINYNNSDLYAVSSGYGIYKSVGSTGAWTKISPSTGNNSWNGVAINSLNGDIYSGFGNAGDFYKQTGGVGNFNALNQPLTSYRNIAINNSNGNVYTIIFNGTNVDLYQSTGFLTGGTANLSGGVLQLKGGQGKGNAQSRIQFITGAKQASGTNLQPETLRLTIDENGDATFTGNIIKAGGTSAQFLKANGSTDSTAYISLGNITGSTNFIPKYVTSGITNSRIQDDGTFVGISTFVPPLFDLSFGFSGVTGRTISVEDSNSTTVGKDLIVKAGRAVNYNIIKTFTPLNETFRSWQNDGLAINSTTNDVYASTNQFIYKRTGGVGAFVQIAGVTQRTYQGIAVNSANNDVYACVYNDTIYKQAGGTGNFNATTGAPVKAWSTIAVNSNNGDVYACPQNDVIYKQTGGVGAFNAVSGLPASTTWFIGINTTTNDVYATGFGKDIYKQTGGVGNFVGLGYTVPIRYWQSMDVNSSTGDIILSESSSGTNDIFKIAGGVGALIPYNQPQPRPTFIGLAINSSNGDIYGVASGADFWYLKGNDFGTPNLSGGTLQLKSGVGKGTGASRIQFLTGAKLASGTTQQTETERLRIDEDGISTFTGRIDINATGNFNSIQAISTGGGITSTSSGVNNAAYYGRATGANSFALVAENQNATGTAIWGISNAGGDIARFNGNAGQVARIDNAGNIYANAFLTGTDIAYIDNNVTLVIDANVNTYVYWKSTANSAKIIYIDNLADGKSIKFFFKDDSGSSNTIQLLARPDNVSGYNNIDLAYNANVSIFPFYNAFGAIFTEVKNISNNYFGFVTS